MLCGCKVNQKITWQMISLSKDARLAFFREWHGAKGKMH